MSSTYGNMGMRQVPNVTQCSIMHAGKLDAGAGATAYNGRQAALQDFGGNIGQEQTRHGQGTGSSESPGGQMIASHLHARICTADHR